MKTTIFSSILAIALICSFAFQAKATITNKTFEFSESIGNNKSRVIGLFLTDNKFTRMEFVRGPSLKKIHVTNDSGTFKHENGKLTLNYDQTGCHEKKTETVDITANDSGSEFIITEDSKPLLFKSVSGIDFEAYQSLVTDKLCGALN